MYNDQSQSQMYTMINMIGVLTAYVMLALSVWLAPVDLSTKGYWGMGIFLLTLSLINVVKYRNDERVQREKHAKIEAAKNDKILEEFAAN